MRAMRPFSSALWDQTPAAIQDYIAALEARVAALESTVQRLEGGSPALDRARAAELPELVAAAVERSPQVSGKQGRRQPSGRRAGGQLGHEGHTRGLVPVEEVDVVVLIKPERCHHCQHPLQGEDPQPQCQQVTELPPLKPVVTEYQLHRLSCPVCGEANRADLPPGIPAGGFGPRVQAITALCTGASHLSKRAT